MNPSILVVDDDPMVLTVTVKILQRLGYHVISCSSAEQALALCRSSIMDSVHLLLSDVNMPKQNGFELAQCLVEQRPDLRVLFMSGARHNHDGQKAIMDAIQYRNWQVIAKPFTMEKLRLAVEQVLRND